MKNPTSRVIDPTIDMYSLIQKKSPHLLIFLVQLTIKVVKNSNQIVSIIEALGFVNPLLNLLEVRAFIKR